MTIFSLADAEARRQTELAHHERLIQEAEQLVKELRNGFVSFGHILQLRHGVASEHFTEQQIGLQPGELDRLHHDIRLELALHQAAKLSQTHDYRGRFLDHFAIQRALEDKQGITALELRQALEAADIQLTAEEVCELENFDQSHQLDLAAVTQ